MKIIDLLNRIANGKAPEKIKFANTYWYRKNGVRNVYYFDEDYRDLFLFLLKHNLSYNLNDEIEILNEIEEKEEKKIPEKHINNCGDLIILGQQDNWTQKFNIKTKEMETTGIELNPYVFEAINENFKDIENKIYEIIDYLKSKGE